MKQKLKAVDATSLSETQVADYLREHPAFFENHLELLESMQLSEPNQDVVSLTMRQIGLLRERNGKLQSQLENLLNIARDNDSLFGRMQNLTLALIDARTVEDLFATLDQTLRDCFDADFFAIRILSEDGLGLPISNVFLDPESPAAGHFNKVLEHQKVKCGHPTHGQAETLFGSNANQALSSAIIPFRVKGRPAILGIGSSDPDRFHPTMGNLFLIHLGELAGRRLDSLLDTDSK